MRCYRAPVQLTVIHIHSTMLACDISPRPLLFFNPLDTDGSAPPIYGRDTAPHQCAPKSVVHLSSALLKRQ